MKIYAKKSVLTVSQKKKNIFKAHKKIISTFCNFVMVWPQKTRLRVFHVLYD